jgi:two-component system sensor histidine kinase and response regulator WspE
MATFDPSLLDLYRAELETHLPVLSEGLLALEKGADQPGRLEALMRAAHSIKGAARIVGVDPAVQVAHVLEDSFVAAQKGQLTLGSDAVDVLLRGVDALGQFTPSADDGTIAFPEARLAQLLAELGGVRSGQAPARSPPPPPPAAAPTELVASGPVTLVPPGDLDTAATEALRGQLAELFAQGVPRVRLDFTAVREVSARGLLLLSRAARDAGRRQPPVVLELLHAAPPVRQLLRLTRLESAFVDPRGGV